jgi:hypothetical protein
MLLRISIEIAALFESPSRAHLSTLQCGDCYEGGNESNRERKRNSRILVTGYCVIIRELNCLRVANVCKLTFTGSFANWFYVAALLLARVISSTGETRLRHCKRILIRLRFSGSIQTGIIHYATATGPFGMCE